MNNISEYNETSIAKQIIDLHVIGSLRDEADLDNAKYHANTTIGVIENLFKEIEGSVEDKLSFIEKVKNEIPKFTGKSS